jgi:hypothetical protein
MKQLAQLPLGASPAVEVCAGRASCINRAGSLTKGGESPGGRPHHRLVLAPWALSIAAPFFVKDRCIWFLSSNFS